MDCRLGTERGRVLGGVTAPLHTHPTTAPYLRWNRLGRPAAERADCLVSWASADRWLPSGVRHWAVCANPRTATHSDKQSRQRPLARTLPAPAGRWQRRRAEKVHSLPIWRGEAASVAALMAKARARALTQPRNSSNLAARQSCRRAGHMGRRREISVEPFARRRNDYACAEQRRPRLEVRRHKRYGAVPEDD